MTKAPEKVIQTNVKQGALLGGVVCLLVGLGFMAISFFWLPVYGAFFLAAFILSIVAMAQKRVAGGVILLLATLIGPLVFASMLMVIKNPAVTDLISHNGENPTATAPVVAPPAISSPTPKESVATTQTAVEMPTQVAPPKSKHPALDDKFGFRTYKLGTPLSNFTTDELEEGTTFIKTDTRVFFVKNFDKQIGAAEIDSIALYFLQDTLQSIRVSVKGEQSCLGLKEALIAAYGHPDKEDTFMGDSLTWEGDDCVLEYTSLVDGHADFSSKSVDAKIAAITEAKAMAGAGAGAKNL